MSALDRFDAVIDRCRILLEMYEKQSESDKNDDIIRAAVVLSAAGMDHYVKTAFVDFLIPFLRNPSKRINKNLELLFKDAGVDLMAVFKGFKKDGDKGVMSVLLEKVRAKISSRTFQRTKNITELFECYGLGKVIEDAERKTHRRLVDAVEALVTRRNAIAHAADWGADGNACEISFDEIVESINNLNELIFSVDSIVNSSINGKQEIDRNTMSVSQTKPGRFKSIDVEQHFAVPRIRDIVKLFGVKVSSRGFLMPGAVDLDKSKRLVIWWPRIAPAPNHAGWKNEIVGDGVELVERNVKDDTTNGKLLAENIERPSTRIVFANIFGTKCDTGYCYQFLGTYELDVAASQARQACVWRRTAKTWRFSKG